MSDIPQRVQFSVFLIKCDEHWRSSHAPCHGTAVDIVPIGKKIKLSFHNLLIHDCHCLFIGGLLGLITVL